MIIKKYTIFFIVILSAFPWLKAQASTITLQTILKSTTLHFPIIKAAEKNIAIAYGKLQAAKGAFDPSINSWLKSTPQGGYENIYDENQIKVPIAYAGSNFFATYRIGGGNWPSYYQNFLTNSGGDVIVGLDFSLLRDFYIDPRRAKFQSAKINIYLQKSETNKIIIDSLQQAGVYYWNWIAAARKLKFVKQLLKLAIKRQAALTRRYHLGDSAKIDMVENQRLILQRKSNLTYAQLNYTRSSILLSLYYRNKDAKPLLPKIQQIPKDLPDLIKANFSPNAEKKVFDFIIAHNPGMNILNKKIKIQELKLKLAKNNLLPSLDADVSTEREYGTNGDPLLRKTAVNVGLKFSVDFPRNIAKGQFQKVRGKLFQLHQQKIYLKQKLRIQFDNVINEIKNDIKQVNILENELKLSIKVENAEKIRFDQGDSSIFLVNQREESTFTNRMQLLDAKIAYYISSLKLKALCTFKSNCMKKLTRG